MDARSAVGAGEAIPAVELRVGAVCVVGGQHARHDEEEVIDPPFRERSMDGLVTFSFAELFVLHVRMSD